MYSITLFVIDIHNISCLEPFLSLYDHFEIRKFLGLNWQYKLKPCFILCTSEECASYKTLDRDDWNQPGSKSLVYHLRPGHTPHEGGLQRHYPFRVLLILLEDGLVVQGRGGEWQWQESLPHRVDVALQGGGWGGAESLIKDLFRATDSQNC